MPDYLVEIECSTLNTYKITAVDEADAKDCVLKSYLAMDAIEEHENVQVNSCVEVFD